MIKKIATFLGILLLILTSQAVVFGQSDDDDIFGIFDDAIEAEGNVEFGFSDEDEVQAVDPTDTTITIVAPIVYDGADPILEYDISYA